MERAWNKKVKGSTLFRIKQKISQCQQDFIRWKVVNNEDDKLVTKKHDLEKGNLFLLRVPF